MAGKQLVVNLKDIPLLYISGDNVILTNQREVIFPSCINKVSIGLSLSNIYDAFFLNNLFIVVNFVPSVGYGIYVFDLRTNSLLLNITSSKYAGIVQAGNMVYLFYEGNKVIAIDSIALSNNTYTITLNGANQSIEKVRQFNSQSFLLLTLNPTTVYVNSILDLLSISSKNTDITSFTYSTHSFPTKNIELYPDNETIYVSGDDGTVVLTLKTQDLVYLKTEYVSPVLLTPIEIIPTVSELFGSGFRVDRLFSNNTYRVYNIVEDQYIYLHPITKQLYLSNNYIFLHRAIYDPLIGDLIYIEYDNLNTACKIENNRLSIKVVLDDIATFYKIVYKLQSTTLPSLIKAQIETKYLQSYNTFSYNLVMFRNYFNVNVKGDTFIFHILPEYAIRFNDLNFVFIT
jgi:WD40 repeat protein